MTDYFAGDSRSNRERMLAGDLYIADDAESAGHAIRAAQLCDRYYRSWLNEDPDARDVLVQLLGALGESAEVKPPLSVDYGENTFIGAGTFVNFNLTALDVARITIGEDCQIGPNVQLLTATHPIDPVTRRARLEGSSPITIGNNVWLGGGVIVCPGVTIGDNSVIGAGAVVTKNIPADVVAVGNPARVIRAVS